MKYLITESQRYRMIDDYLTKNIKSLDETFGNHGGSGRVDFVDKSENSIVIIFFNRTSQEDEGMIDEKLYEEIYNMFSMDGFDEIQEHLVRWFKENFDGLNHITEVVTFDNDEYVY